MKKTIIIILIPLFLLTCKTSDERTMKSCSYRCNRKMVWKYTKWADECRDFCINRADKITCLQKCLEWTRDDCYIYYDTCINKCTRELQVYQKHYKWLTPHLYKLYSMRARQYRVPLRLALALIHVESRGKNVISRTHDYGRMQVNKIHMRHNPKQLLNDKINSRIGFWYLSAALKKSNWNKREAVRLYNQGLAGKRWKYRNWNYVAQILNAYQNNI